MGKMIPNKILCCDSVLSQSNISHGFTTRLIEEEQIASNRPTQLAMHIKAVSDHTHIPIDKIYALKQVHGTDIVEIVASSNSTILPAADGMVTKEKGVALVIHTADCTPVLCADPENSIIGAAHAGWKGAYAGIIGRLIEHMEGIGAKRDNIAALIGPTIRQSSYEVDAAFKERFITLDLSNETLFIPSDRPMHYRFDLPKFVKMDLSKAGVKYIVDCNHNTYTEETLFHSYRRKTHRNEQYYGGQLSYIYS